MCTVDYFSLSDFYNMSEDFICASLNSSSAIRQELCLQRKLFPITTSERLVYEIVGSFDILLAAISLILLSKVESLKEPPSEILIIMSIYTIVKTLLIYIAISNIFAIKFTLTSKDKMSVMRNSTLFAKLQDSQRSVLDQLSLYIPYF